MSFALPSSLVAGLRCRCPRCGEGRVFDGYLKLAERCEACGLDYGFAEPADGPAFFATSLVGLAVVGAWAWWAVAMRPPVWAQLALTMPLMVAGCAAALRPIKAWLVAEQYVHKAEEARWDSIGRHGAF
jgi:uncharacterized protein (DUF983 family)